MKIKNFDDFTNALLQSGFSVGGGNNEGIFSLSSQFDENVVCHTGDPETDPWEWRMRILEERNDIAYAKLFFHKSGYITKEWYPYFLAVRRKYASFEEEYQSGTVSQYAKRIYSVIRDNGATAFHSIKLLGGFSKEDNSKFEHALIELQKKMVITMCGRKQKVSSMGMEYGWYSTMFCTTEAFFGEDIFQIAENISAKEAIKKITSQIYTLNPDADEKKIMKFING